MVTPSNESRLVLLEVRKAAGKLSDAERKELKELTALLRGEPEEPTEESETPPTNG